MTIIETIAFFERLLKETVKKRELKVYKSFIDVLSNLENRNLTDDELLRIQNEIETFDLKSNPENKRKYYSKKLNVFKAFLKEEFSLISEGYYIAIGMSLGMCFGVAIGSSLEATGTSTGVAIGMVIGLTIGRIKDMEAEKQNRVLKNEKH